MLSAITLDLFCYLCNKIIQQFDSKVTFRINLYYYFFFFRIIILFNLIFWRILVLLELFVHNCEFYEIFLKNYYFNVKNKCVKYGHNMSIAFLHI